MSDDFRHARPLAQAEVEARIAAVIEAMEAATDHYDEISEQAAEAEADYRRDAAHALLAVIQHGETKMTVAERQARADLMTADAHKQHLIRTAARNSAREHLQTLRAHLDALRTLNASIRQQT